MNEKEAITGLAHGVVIQAATDWRKLCSDKETLVIGQSYEPINNMYLSFAEIRRFLKSEWCGLLCGKVNPQLILAKLEKEREDALNELNRLEAGEAI